MPRGLIETLHWVCAGHGQRHEHMPYLSRDNQPDAGDVTVQSWSLAHWPERCTRFLCACQLTSPHDLGHLTPSVQQARDRNVEAGRRVGMARTHDREACEKSWASHIQ